MRRLLTIITCVSALACLLSLVSWVVGFFGIASCYYFQPYGSSDQSWGIDATTQRHGVRVIVTRMRRFHPEHQGEHGFGGNVYAADPTYDIYVHQRKYFRSFAGVVWWGTTASENDPGPPRGVVETRLHHEVIVSSGFLVLVAAVLPVAWLVIAYRSRRVARQGRCVHCGYDLRATPDRCPECGAAANAAAKGVA